MAIIKCKMCGGDIELAADKTFGTCEYCGSTMTFPKVDDEQRAAAFNRGNHFRRIGEFDKALAVYERIVRENEGDAEAHWCCALCRFGIEYVEDPASYEYLPTCHRASFDSFLEDVDYLAAVEHSVGVTRRQYQKDAARIAEVQRGILATSQNAEPYDVFICYKESDESGSRTRDSLMAQDIYYQLTEQGRKVFFARITLEDVAGTQYEPYIFAALNSARVMIVVGTKPEYMNAVWVKNEWSRFLAMMKKDRHKLLLPCYRDMDPYDMPEQLSVLQSYDMSKIGFIQDLIRGVAKVLDAEQRLEPTMETAGNQRPAGSNAAALLERGFMALEDSEWDKADGFFEEVLNQDARCVQAYMGKLLAEIRIPSEEKLNTCGICFTRSGNYKKAIRFADQELLRKLKAYENNNVAYMLTQGNACLETKDWARADRLFNQVLESDPNHLGAHLGKLFAEVKVKGINDLPGCRVRFWETSANYKKVLELADEELRNRLEQEIVQINRNREIYEKAAAMVKGPTGMTTMQRAYGIRPEDLVTEEDFLAAADLMDSIAGYMNASKLAAEYREKAEEMRQSKIYKSAVGKMRAFTMESLGEAIEQLESIASYRDSREKIEECREKILRMEQNRREKEQRDWWRANNLCQHCGGKFKGLFTKTCENCGRTKDY